MILNDKRPVEGVAEEEVSCLESLGARNLELQHLHRAGPATYHYPPTLGMNAACFQS